LEGGYSQRQAAESLGINVSTLKIWIDRLRHEFGQPPRKGGASAESTIKRLEAENARLRMERDILKRGFGVLCGQLRPFRRRDTGCNRPPMATNAEKGQGQASAPGRPAAGGCKLAGCTTNTSTPRSLESRLRGMSRKWTWTFRAALSKYMLSTAVH
jgi:hypothetical protein